MPKPNWNYWKLRPNAPQNRTHLGDIRQIENFSAKEFTFGKGKSAFSMFVIRQNDNVYGYLNLCPHFSLPLNFRKESFLNEDLSRISCTMHFAEFNIEDGYCVAGAAAKCFLDPIPVVNDAGELFIDPDFNPHFSIV